MIRYDVAVIGAGIAGLTAAALLARDGANVILLEQHDKPGGCAGYFDISSKWGDFQFPVGATVALGLNDGGLHREIFEALGVECPATPIDRLSIFLPDTRIELWHDAEKVPAARVAALLERATEGWGAVTLYIALREEVVPADLPLHCQILARYAATPPYMRAGAGDDVFLSLSPRGDESSAPRGWRTLNVSTHVRLRDWRNLSKNEYREQKKIWRDRLLEGARGALPDFDAAKGFVITGTPSSWEEYTLRAGGSVGGAPLSRRNSNLRALPSRIGLPDFRLVGDSTFPGQGTVACALSGYNAWRDVIGFQIPDVG